MRLSDPRRYPDKALDRHRLRERARRAAISGLLTDELIEEHRHNPLGTRPNFHSSSLQRVLNYLRAQPLEQRYVPILLDEGIGVVGSRPGQPPVVLEGVLVDVHLGGGEVLELRRGLTVYFPAGLRATWEIKERYEQFVSILAP